MLYFLLFNYYAGAGMTCPRLSFCSRLPLWFYGIVAIAAVNGLVLPGLEGNLGLLAALRTCRLVHLALETTGPAAVARRLPGSPAIGAALGIVGEPFLSIELLLGGAERELLVAVRACHFFVCETHG
jgi:hypothetical protein